MRKGNLIVGFVLVMFLASFVCAEECVDGDVGMNLYVYSAASVGTTSSWDRCEFSEGNDFVMEAYCVTETEVSWEKVKCPVEFPYCNEGVCSKIEIKPVDSDGGNNPMIKGEVDMNENEWDPIIDECIIDGYTKDCSGEGCVLNEYFVENRDLKSMIVWNVKMGLV
jgi:hypothetical protein